MQDQSVGAKRGAFGAGFVLAPASGLLLFVAAFLLVHLSQFPESTVGADGGVVGGLVLLLPLGLVAVYALVGVLGIPTVWFLYSRSLLSFLSVNAAALLWTMILCIGFRVLGRSVNGAESASTAVASAIIASLFFAPFVLFAATVFHWIVRRGPATQFGLVHIFALMAILGGALTEASVLRSAMEPHVVADVAHPNGSRLLVTQKYGFISEPFVTEIFFDDGDGRWRWYYYDHEDSYWHSAEYRIVGTEIRLSSPGNRRVQMDTANGQCLVSGVDGRTRAHAKSTRFDVSPPT
ncbi:MAG: hypothetical protein Aurels2KO_11910 [Aureliella sp.]